MEAASLKKRKWGGVGGRGKGAPERNDRNWNKDDRGLLCGLHIHNGVFSTEAGKLRYYTHATWSKTFSGPSVKDTYISGVTLKIEIIFLKRTVRDL